MEKDEEEAFIIIEEEEFILSITLKEIARLEQKDGSAVKLVYLGKAAFYTQEMERDQDEQTQYDYTKWDNNMGSV